MSSVETATVLFVDDEENILQAYRRNLRKQFQILTAASGPEALKILDDNPGLMVIVSDMRMPDMDGVQLLETVKERHPDLVRVMLTGNADQQTATDAINRGDIFRFHTKPCAPEILADTLNAAVSQFQVRKVERDLLQNTLRGSINALVEVLALVNPEAFGRTRRIADLTCEVASIIGMKDLWFPETLATLSQIGCVILPGTILDKLYQGAALNEEEKQLFDMHPGMGAEIIGKIPRMESFAENMRYQMKNFDGSGVPRDAVKGTEIPAGARILHVVIDFDNQISGGLAEHEAYSRLLEHQEWYDPNVLRSLKRVIDARKSCITRPVTLDELHAGMVLARDVRATDGTLLISKGYTVSGLLLERLNVFSRNQQLEEPLYVADDRNPEAGNPPPR